MAQRRSKIDPWAGSEAVQHGIACFRSYGREVKVMQACIIVRFGSAGEVTFDESSKFLEAVENLYQGKISSDTVTASNSPTLSGKLIDPDQWSLRDLCCLLLVYMYCFSYDHAWSGPQHATSLRLWLRVDCSPRLVDGAVDILKAKRLIEDCFNVDGRSIGLQIEITTILKLDESFYLAQVSPKQIAKEIDTRVHRTREFYRRLCSGVESG